MLAIPELDSRLLHNRGPDLGSACREVVGLDASYAMV